MRIYTRAYDFRIGTSARVLCRTRVLISHTDFVHRAPVDCYAVLPIPMKSRQSCITVRLRDPQNVPKKKRTLNVIRFIWYYKPNTRVYVSSREPHNRIFPLDVTHRARISCEMEDIESRRTVGFSERRRSRPKWRNPRKKHGQVGLTAVDEYDATPKHVIVIIVFFSTGNSSCRRAAHDRSYF